MHQPVHHRHYIIADGRRHKTLHTHGNDALENACTAITIEFAEHIVEQHHWTL